MSASASPAPGRPRRVARRARTPGRTVPTPRNGGRWPSTEEVVQAFVGLTWQTPYGPVTMRSDHQAVHGAIVGLTKFDPTYGFAIMSHIRAFEAEEIMPPLGVRTHDWLKTLK